MRCAGWYKMMIKFATLLILPLQSRNCLLTNCSRNCDIFLSLCLEYCFLPAEERKEPENVFLTHLGVWKLMCWGSSYMAGCNVPAFLLLSVIACTTFRPPSPLKLARFSQCLFHCRDPILTWRFHYGSLSLFIVKFVSFVMVCNLGSFFPVCCSVVAFFHRTLKIFLVCHFSRTLSFLKQFFLPEFVRLVAKGNTIHE